MLEHGGNEYSESMRQEEVCKRCLGKLDHVLASKSPNIIHSSYQQIKPDRFDTNIFDFLQLRIRFQKHAWGTVLVKRSKEVGKLWQCAPSAIVMWEV